MALFSKENAHKLTIFSINNMKWTQKEKLLYFEDSFY